MTPEGAAALLLEEAGAAVGAGAEELLDATLLLDDAALLLDDATLLLDEATELLDEEGAVVGAGATELLLDAAGGTVGTGAAVGAAHAATKTARTRANPTNTTYFFIFSS